MDEGYDLAIRFGALKDSTLMARKLTDMRIVCCVSPDYLTRHGTPETPDDLVAHNCLLQTTGNNVDQWEFKGPSGTYSVTVTGNFRANSPRAVANMAADGLGIGRVPLYTAQPFLDAGSLQLLYQGQEAKVLNLYATYPPNRHLSARIRTLIDHLVAELRPAVRAR